MNFFISEGITRWFTFTPVLSPNVSPSASGRSRYGDPIVGPNVQEG